MQSKSEQSLERFDFAPTGQAEQSSLERVQSWIVADNNWTGAHLGTCEWLA